jgi:hypothetical protein
VSSSIPGVSSPCGSSSALPCSARSSASPGDQPPVATSSSAKARAVAARNSVNSASVIGRSVTVLTARSWHRPSAGAVVVPAVVAVPPLSSPSPRC